MSAETVACPSCGKPALPDYPHRHETPVRPDYDPMGVRPAQAYCGVTDLQGYWVGPWEPECCMAHAAQAAYIAELPHRLHVASVPDQLEPIPLEAGKPEGPTMDVKDTGALGAPSWSMPAHRRFGAVTVLVGEQTVNARDYALFPFALAIERRLPGWCARRHVGRDPDHGERTLCVELVREVVVRGDTLSGAARTVGVPRTVALRVLDDALRFVWKRVSEQLNEVELGRVRRDEA